MSYSDCNSPLYYHRTYVLHIRHCLRLQEQPGTDHMSINSPVSLQKEIVPNGKLIISRCSEI